MLKILLVDDEEPICKGMRVKLSMSLHSEMYEYRYALDGASGIAVSRNWQPDIIIMDINLPDMAGTDAMLSIQSLSPDTVFLALSAYDNYTYVRSMLVHGAIDYLLKPVSIVDLRSALLKAASTLAENRQANTRKIAAKLSILMRDAESMTPEAFVNAFTRSEEFSAVFPHPRYCAVRVMDTRGEAVQPEELLKLVNGSDALALQILPDHFDSALVIMNAAAPETYAQYFACQLQRICSDWYAGISQFALEGAVGLYTALMQSHSAVIAHLIDPTRSVICYSPELSREEHKLFAPESLVNYADSGRLSDIEELIAVCKSVLTRDALSDISPAELESGYLNIMLLLNWYRTEYENSLGSIRPLISFTSIDSLRDYIIQQLEPLKISSNSIPKSSVIKEASTYIKQHYNEPISLRDLADSYYMNYTYFSELFKKEMGTTVSQYITQIRMRHAIRLLRDPSATLNSIAASVGYNSTKTFIQSFKKYTGSSPRKFSDANQ